MAEHRLRIDDKDLDLLTAALRARRAMSKGERRRQLDRLLERLEECAPGNPRWRLGVTSGRT